MPTPNRVEYEVWRFLGIVGIFVITAQLGNCSDPPPDPCDDWNWLDHEHCSADICIDFEDGRYECREGECWCCLEDECWLGEP